MNHVAWIVFFLAAGFLDELILIWYYRAIQGNESTQAAVASFTHGMVYWVLWVWVLSGFVGRDEKALSFAEVVALNLGAAIGCWWVVRKKGDVDE